MLFWKSGLLAAALLLAMPTASAQHGATPGDWAVYPFTNEVRCSGVRCGSADEFAYSGWIAVTTDKTRPGVAFSCSERFGLSATISYAPQDLAAMIRSNDTGRYRPKIRKGRFIIDGERGELVSFYVRRRDSIAVTVKSSTAVSLLAGLAGGKETVFDLPGVADMTFDTPGYTGALKLFVEQCPSVQANR